MVTKKVLSTRRRQILEFIQEFIAENGIPPTVRDIQQACQISSTSVVDYNLQKLRQAGYLNRRPDVARGIELLDESGQPVSTGPKVQIIGVIAAGLPIPVFTTEDSPSSAEFDTIEVSPDLPRRFGSLFGLKVNGTSMIDALIDDGDVVIVMPSREAANGDTVVAWLKAEQEATLKKFYLERDWVRLQPANRQMEPIYSPTENVEVHGKVVQIIRKL